MSETPSTRIDNIDLAHDMAKVMDRYETDALELKKILATLPPQSERYAEIQADIEAAKEESVYMGDLKKQMHEEKITAKEYNKIRKEWLLVSEAIRQEIFTNAKATSTLLEICSLPVTPDLPALATEKICAASPRTAALFKQYANTLGSFFTNSNHPARLLEPIGIFEIARDLKLLALTAEMHVAKKPLEQTHGNVATLPRGTEVAFDPKNIEAQPELIDPANWESRTVIHHRVSEIVIKGKKYILKERRTKEYNTILRINPNKAHSSYDEYTIAKMFEHYATVTDDRITIRFETPLAAVTMPDGYQFSLYAYEPGFSVKNRGGSLIEAIADNEAEFSEEFKEVARIVTDIQNRVTPNTVSKSLQIPTYALDLFKTKSKGIKDFFKKKKPHFKYFSEAKAEYLNHLSYLELTRAENKLGFESHDKNENIRIVKRTPSVHVEIIGYDLEFMLPNKNLNSKTAEENFYNSKRALVKVLDYPRMSPESRLFFLALLVKDGTVKIEELTG